MNSDYIKCECPHCDNTICVKKNLTDGYSEEEAIVRAKAVTKFHCPECKRIRNVKVEMYPIEISWNNKIIDLKE